MKIKADKGEEIEVKIMTKTSLLVICNKIIMNTMKIKTEKEE